ARPARLRVLRAHPVLGRGRLGSPPGPGAPGARPAGGGPPDRRRSGLPPGGDGARRWAPLPRAPAGTHLVPRLRRRARKAAAAGGPPGSPLRVAATLLGPGEQRRAGGAGPARAADR